MNLMKSVSTGKPALPLSINMAVAIRHSHRKSLVRLLQALLREGFLNRQDLIKEGNISWLPLWGQKRMLRMEGLVLGRAGHCQLHGTMMVHQRGQTPRTILTANELLTSILPDTHSDNRARLELELANSVENDALCQHYRQQWKHELHQDITDAGYTRLVSALLDRTNPITHHSAILLEQWGCIGHPFHPGHKSKVGLSVDDVLALSPEFQPQVELVIAAIRTSAARVSSIDDDFNYTTWMSEQYPEEIAAWTTTLEKSGENPQDWLPLPIHPYQAQHLIPTKFADEISRGLLKLGDDFPRMTTTPTMSFRTVASINNPQAPHLKLPVSLQLTSAQRTVSPKATIMGPRVSQLLRELIRKENGFDNTLDILAEEVGLHYIDPNNDADRARHLSILFRENPMTRHRPGYMSIPVAALFADSPVDGRPILLELVSSAYGDSVHGALDYFRDYAQKVLQASLSAYLLYGIAFEAHQQNSLVLINERGQVQQLLLRDFGDIRIHTPTLQAQGLHIDNHQSGHILFDDETIVREKFLHTTMLCHLVEIAVLLARSYQQSEDRYWNIVDDAIVMLFDQLRDRCEPARWQQERCAILEANWPVKSLLRMRLDNTVDDICLSMSNPLTAVSNQK